MMIEHGFRHLPVVAGTPLLGRGPLHAGSAVAQAAALQVQSRRSSRQERASLSAQDAAAAALIFKTEVLWSPLDALPSAYVAPGRIPPGAWQPHQGLA